MDFPYETFESLNVRGIKGDKKRQDMFHWLKQRNTMFFLIADTHCNSKTLSKNGKMNGLTMKKTAFGVLEPTNQNVLQF